MTYFITDNLKLKVPKDIQESSGCYALVLFDKNKPKIIPRIFGSDKDGILYIGKADNLIKRIKSLQDSVLHNSDENQMSAIEKGHKSLSRKYFRIRKNINVNDLKIKIWAKDDLDPEKLESYLLEIYVLKCGELPPLNGQYGKYSLDNG